MQFKVVLDSLACHTAGQFQLSHIIYLKLLTFHIKDE